MKRLYLFILFSLLFAVPAFSQAGLQTVAIVNLIRSEPITVNQLRTEVQTREAAAGRTSTIAERRVVLDDMINERLISQAAERDRIIVTDNEVNQQLQELRNLLAQNIGRQPTEAEFAQAVRNEYGMEVAAFREMVRKQLIAQKYLMSKKGDLINSVKMPTEQEIVSEYNLLKSQLVRPDTVRFSAIQIPFSDAASKTRARETGERLLREIGSSTSKFDEIVARGQTSNSDYQAGDSGYIPRSQEARNALGQTLLEAAFSLRQGQISSLIEGIQSFFIIKVTENYTQKNMELDDIILGVIPTLTVRNYIAQGLYEERQAAVLTKAAEELIAELRNGRSFQVFENYLNW